MFKYFKGSVSAGFMSIYTGRMVLRVSLVVFNIFFSIFLFRLFGYDIRYVLIFFLLVHFIYAITVAFGAQYLNKFGLRRCLRISVIWGALHYLFFYFLARLSLVPGEALYDNRALWLLLGAIITAVLFRLFYWIPMNTDLAKFTNHSNRARQVSLMEATSIIVGAIVPIASGWILTYYGFDLLFILAVIIYLLSLIPFAGLPRTRESFSWTYLETWKHFLSPKMRSQVLGYMGDGAETLVASAIWPIFIWQILKGNFFQLGILASAIVVVSIVLQLAVGRFFDQGNQAKIIKYGSWLYSLGWVVKIFIVTAFQIFIVDTYHSMARIFTRTSFDAILYEEASNQGHYVDEYTAIHEMAVQFGKVLMIIFSLILTIFFDIQWIFLIAAVASLSLNLMVKEKTHSVERVTHNS